MKVRLRGVTAPRLISRFRTRSLIRRACITGQRRRAPERPV
nr:MAG TPA: hypothetical protein [Caudoviricetes sp.]